MVVMAYSSIGCRIRTPSLGRRSLEHDGAIPGPRTRVSPEGRNATACDDDRMQQRWRRVLARVAVWPLVPGLLVGAAVADAAVGGGARIGPSDLAVVVAMIACWLIGVVITAHAPGQRAGWAFLGLGTALAWSAFCDEYAQPGRTGEVPAGVLVATLGDASFVWWFVFLALVLQYTAPGPRRGAVRVLPTATVVIGVLFQALALLRSTPLAAPYRHLSSPLTVAALDRPARILAAVAVYTLAGCLVASFVPLVRAWRRPEEDSRRQLLWLVAGALPLVPAVVSAFVFSGIGRDAYAAAVLAAGMVSLVTGAGLSVLRYRLYDVERVVTESAAYAIASVAVLVAYVAVVVVVSRTGPLGGGSPPVTVAATLAGVLAARLSYGWGRRAVGRRVNPARFRAVEAVRAGLADPSADLDDLVTAAVGRRARVLFPAAEGTWVTSGGHAVEPAADGVDVRRHDHLVARLEYDPRETRRDLVEAVAGEAAAELDNVALRAELARQIELIRASRARLANAHEEERRRIERDLHDGAQQRLLAVALQLQSARLNGDSGVLAAEADRAIQDLQDTVQELRDIAAGLQPAALAGGGLVAAVADLAARAPVTLSYDVVDVRVAADIESAAWFVIAESVTNAVKHSGAGEVEVAVRRAPQSLRVEIRDEGSGGADPSGHGLQGLADRVDAVDGSLRVCELAPHGTAVKAVFPCVW
jgi:signal transduction histidine kinase